MNDFIFGSLALVTMIGIMYSVALVGVRYCPVPSPGRYVDLEMGMDDDDEDATLLYRHDQASSSC